MTDLVQAVQCGLSTIVFDARDWAGDRRLAWIYGILIGWDAPAWRELAEQFGYDAASIARARKYHKALMAAKKLKTKAK